MRTSLMKNLTGGAALVAALLASCANDAAAAEPSDACKALAQRVAHAAGLALGKPDEAKKAFVLRAGHGADIHIRCASESNRTAIVEVASKAELPARAFYDSLAKIGAAVTGRPAKDVRKRLHKCHRVAKREADGIAERAVHGVSLECHRSEAGSSFLFKGPFPRQPG
jgi:hypothetical protein